MTVLTDPGIMTLELDKIHPGKNVRELDQEHVEALAGSIKLIGLLVPLTVTQAASGKYNLVAGFHRYAACKEAGIKAVPVVQRAEGEGATDAAVENIVRKDLTPYEEAIALKRAMAKGLSEDGAAQALGWSLQLVHNRQRILAMPERLQPMAGIEIPLASVDTIAAVHEAFPLVGEAICDNVTEGQYLRNFGAWFLARMDTGDRDLAIWDITRSFRLDTALDLTPKPRWRAATKRKIDLLSKDKENWELPTIHFLDEQVDHARALGCLLEVHDGDLLIDNKKNEVLVELMSTAIEAYQPPARAKAEAKGKTEKTPQQQLESTRTKAHNSQKLAIANAHVAQKHRILDQLANVEVDMDVARFFVYGLLGPDYARYGVQGNCRGVDVHARGFGSMSPEITRIQTSNGNPGKPKISYPLLGIGLPKDEQGVEKAGARNDEALWKFIDAAKTPGELFGRALCLFAAADLVIPQVLPVSKQFHNPQRGNHSQAPRSHKDNAAKALHRLMKKYDVAAPELRAALKAWVKVDRDADAELKKLRGTTTTTEEES